MSRLLYLFCIFRPQMLYTSYCNLVHIKNDAIIPFVYEFVDFQDTPCPAVDANNGAGGSSSMALKSIPVYINIYFKSYRHYFSNV